MDVTPEEHASYLMHYGTPRHSGRYPWGSGDNPYQRNANFRSHVLDLRHKGMSDAEIARGMGMSKNELIAAMSRARAENRAEDVAEAKRLVGKGYSQSAAARQMGINESQLRNLLKEDIQEKCLNLYLHVRTKARDWMCSSHPTAMSIPDLSSISS